MKFMICLRDLAVKKGWPCKMILEVQRDIDYDEPHPKLAYVEIPEEGALNEFVEKARALLPLKEKRVDVYIGHWDQGTFTIPKKFFELIAETGWKVTFDINS